LEKERKFVSPLPSPPGGVLPNIKKLYAFICTRFFHFDCPAPVLLPCFETTEHHLTFAPDTMETSNRPDEWKVEQGLSGAVLPVLDMTGPKNKPLELRTFGPLTKDQKAIDAVGDRDVLFTRERKGWIG
jgi:hypothetical protein